MTFLDRLCSALNQQKLDYPLGGGHAKPVVVSECSISPQLFHVHVMFKDRFSNTVITAVGLIIK